MTTKILETAEACPQCAAGPLDTVQGSLITVQMAESMGIDPEGDQAQQWNAFASKHDAAMCRSCGWSGYVKNAAPGIEAGGMKMRIAVKCEECTPAQSFESLDELAAHGAAAHGWGVDGV